MYSDPILPPLLALAIVFLSNIVFPIAAIFLTRRLKRRTWLPHAASILWLVSSVFILAFLGLADIPPDEDGPIGQAAILIPVIFEVAVGLLCYMFMSAWLITKRLVAR